MNKIGPWCLGIGLTLLSLAAAICQFVLHGLLAFPLFLLSLAFLIAGVIGVRSDVARRYEVIGLALLVGGLLVLILLGWETSVLAYQEAIHWSRPSQPPPAFGAWLTVIAAWVFSAGVVGIGVRYRTGWTWWRCVGWGAAAFAVCPISLVMFFVLCRLGLSVAT